MAPESAIANCTVLVALWASGVMPVHGGYDAVDGSCWLSLCLHAFAHWCIGLVGLHFLEFSGHADGN